MNIVVDGTEGGGKYESSEIGIRLVDGVDEIDLDGTSEDVDAEPESVVLYVDGEEPMTEFDLGEGWSPEVDGAFPLKFIWGVLEVKSINSPDCSFLLDAPTGM